MKIFISMGMKDKSTAQVKKEMVEVVKKIEDSLPNQVIDPIDSVIENADEKIAELGDGQGLWYLGESFKMMAHAELVFFVEGYEEFRGCRLERKAAEAYGKLCVDFKL